MILLGGHWIFTAGKSEFHIVNNICVAVFCEDGFWSPHTAFRAKVVGVIGPSRREKNTVQIGDSLLFTKQEEAFYSPPVHDISPPQQSFSFQRKRKTMQCSSTKTD